MKSIARGVVQSQAQGIFPFHPPFILVWELHDFYELGLSATIWTAKDWQWSPGQHDLLPFEVCPFPLAGITEEILSYLVSLTNLDSPEKDSGTCNSPASLAPEILDNIVSQLIPFEDPPLSPTRILAPSQWRAMLFSGKILPWLWDLDITVLGLKRHEDTPPYDEEVLDWELLARQFAQGDVFSDGKRMAAVQLGLRNRRRIWKLVDVAKLGDWKYPLNQ